MKFTPKTEAELADDMFGAGTYDFEVIEAEETVSKSAGNDMIVIKLRLWNRAGKTITIQDWLLDKMPHKLRHFFEATNLTNEYNRGEIIPGRLLGKQGRVACILNERGYLKVKDYEKPGAAPARRAPPPVRPVGHDDSDSIPF